MAFVSMVIVWIVIAAVILGLLLMAGLILLIVGIVGKVRAKNAGKKSPAVCIILGAVLLALPVFTAAGLGIWGISSCAGTAFQRTTYECVPDRWRNEWVMDSQAEEDIIQALLSSADSGDREAFSRNFTPELQSKAGFDQAVNAFFAAYPKGFSGCEQKDKSGGGSGSYNAGHNVKTYSTHFNTTLDGNWYYISIGFCYDNTDEPDKVGVTNFKIMNLEASAVFFDEYSRNMDYGSDVYLLCDIRSSSEVSARLIGGEPLLWTPTDTPKLTADQMRELLAPYERLDDPALMKTIGTANASRKYVNCSWFEYYYELASENGEPLYACIHTHSPFDEPDIPYGEILSAYVGTSEKIDYDRSLRPWEDGGNEAQGE